MRSPGAVTDHFRDGVDALADRQLELALHAQLDREHHAIEEPDQSARLLGAAERSLLLLSKTTISASGQAPRTSSMTAPIVAASL